jgi:hypothetical protein
MAEMAKDMEHRRFNAVVCERSGADECDKIAQDRSCVEQTVRQLKRMVDPSSDDASAAGTDDEGTEDETDNEAVQQQGEKEHIASGDENVKIERLAVKTGNHLIDKFESVYFGTAYAFYFLVQLWPS